MTDLVDSYVSWRETAVAVQDAYDRWAGPASADRDVAFAGYSAALQQEAQAAHIYQEQLERFQESHGSSGHGAAPPVGRRRAWPAARVVSQPVTTARSLPRARSSS